MGYLDYSSIFRILENFVFLVMVDVLKSVNKSVEFWDFRYLYVQLLHDQLVVFICTATGYKQFFYSWKIGFNKLDHLFYHVGEELGEADKGVIVNRN